MRPILSVTINYIYMERTYVFNQEPNGGGSKFDIMALLPNLMGGKGVDPGLLALLNQGRNNQDALCGVHVLNIYNIQIFSVLSIYIAEDILYLCIVLIQQR